MAAFNPASAHVLPFVSDSAASCRFKRRSDDCVYEASRASKTLNTEPPGKTHRSFGHPAAPFAITTECFSFFPDPFLREAEQAAGRLLIFRSVEAFLGCAFSSCIGSSLDCVRPKFAQGAPECRRGSFGSVFAGARF